MNKIIIIISLFSIIYMFSAYALTCPPKVMCIDDGSGAKCTADLPGSPWYQFQNSDSKINLPKLNTLYYFNLIEADSATTANNPAFLWSSCIYNMRGNIPDLFFITNFTLTADVKAVGNNWINSEMYGKICKGSVGQCPFIIVTAKNY